MSVLCFTVHWQGDTKVGACMVPLDGDENSFSYNSRTCEHILAEAVGRDQKKSARWVRGRLSYMCPHKLCPGQCAESGRE